MSKEKVFDTLPTAQQVSNFVYDAFYVHSKSPTT